MGFLVTQNKLDDLSHTVTFTQGADNSDFPFSNSHNGIISQGFKNNASSDPVIIIEFSAATDADLVGIYCANADRNFDVVISYALVDSVNTFQNFGSISHVTANNKFNAIKKTQPIGEIKKLKFTFTNLGKTVINHIHVGRSEEINISAPYVPPMAFQRRQVVKRNNKGLPLGSELMIKPQKLSVNTLAYTPAQINSLFNGTLVRKMETYPFIIYTADGTPAEDVNNGYLCTLDGDLNPPEYVDPNIVNWSFTALGYT